MPLAAGTTEKEPEAARANTLVAMLRSSVTAEGLHAVGRDGAERIKRWLEYTARFAITHAAHVLNEENTPYGQVLVKLLDDSIESFDLVGTVLDEDGRHGNTLYVECKAYSEAGNQGVLYDEYLAVAYSAFARQRRDFGSHPDWEFMWATTHPFAVTTFSTLTTEPAIRRACSAEKHRDRLGDEDYDQELGRLLAPRLWMCIVNDRMLDEMLMGKVLRRAVQAAMVELETARAAS